jgi:hypothetical protein
MGPRPPQTHSKTLSRQGKSRDENIIVIALAFPSGWDGFVIPLFFLVYLATTNNSFHSSSLLVFGSEKID